MKHLRYFPSDLVLNIEPHTGEHGFPVTLNTVGLVQSVDDTEENVTVLWSTGVKSTIRISGVVPKQRSKSTE
jgi:hypothetical protein